VTIRSSSSVVSSPALKTTPQVSTQSEINSRLEWRGGLDNERGYRYRLLRSTSAFLMTTFEYLRPTPLIFVRANMTLSLPSTFVLRRRRMCWNAFLSGTTRAMLSVDGEALAGDLRVERESSHGRRGIGYAVSQTLEIHSSNPPHRAPAHLSLQTNAVQLPLTYSLPYFNPNLPCLGHQITGAPGRIHETCVFFGVR